MRKIVLVLSAFLMVLAGCVSEADGPYVCENPGGPLTKTVVLLIDEGISEGIGYSIERFACDLRHDGYDVITETSTMQSPEEIRGYLKDFHETDPKLVGAFLIGDMPLPYYRLYYPGDGCPGRGPEEYISFQFYQDLDGDYARLDPNACEHQGCYDSHTGKIDSEIWISVLPFAIDKEDTIEKMNRYFQKNHDYRMGIDRPKQGYLRPLIGSRRLGNYVWGSGGGILITTPAGKMVGTIRKYGPFYEIRSTDATFRKSLLAELQKTRFRRYTSQE